MKEDDWFDYRGFSAHSLKLMHDAVLKAIGDDKLAIRKGEEPKYQVYDTLDWERHARSLEAAMKEKEVAFQPANFEAPI